MGNKFNERGLKFEDGNLARLLAIFVFYKSQQRNLRVSWLLLRWCL